MSDPAPMPAAPQNQPVPTEYANYGQRYNVFAVLAFVLVWLTVIGGLIFGYIALAQIKRTGELGRGWALAAVILGWIGLAAGLVVAAIAFWIVSTRA